MPNLKQFKSKEEYLNWYRTYFNNNREKRREYNRAWMRNKRHPSVISRIRKFWRNLTK